MFSTIRLGYRYWQTWPMQPALNPVFAENRVIRTTRFALRFMPIFIMLLLFLHFWGKSNGLSTLITSLFAFSLPFQGLYWLGKRAQQALPPKLQQWFELIQLQLQQQQMALPAFTPPPTYFALAQLLRIAFNNGQYDFMDAL